MEQKFYREKLKREVYDKMIFSFKPEVQETIKHLKGEKADQKPLYERIPEVVKKQNELLQQKRIEIDEQKLYSFKPEINPKVKKNKIII